MAQTIGAEQVTLYDLQQKFGLQQVEDAEFFSEWHENLSALTTEEQQRLGRVKAIYANLSTRSVLENTVKMAIVSPLLDLAGFYLPPFYINTEQEVLLQAEDEGNPIRGRIDVLVLKKQFWVLIIESKRAEFSLKVGVPQALTYMLATPMLTRPLYGMVTNGSSFLFLKLLRQQTPYYARSKAFDLEEGTELQTVLQILKRLAQVVGAET